MTNIPYRTAVGTLLYAAINARPDISFATNQVSLFVENPGMKHWEAVLQIFAYLRKNSELGIIFSSPAATPESFTIHAYCDASYANNQNCRSTTGYLVYLNGSPIAWRTKVQGVVALSSTEAEYMALGDCVKEIMWLKQLLNELDIAPIQECYIFEDNQGAIKLAENPVLHQKTKHIDVRHHFIRELMARDEFKMIYVNTLSQDGDSFTKAKHYPQFSKSRDKYMN